MQINVYLLCNVLFFLDFCFHILSLLFNIKIKECLFLCKWAKKGDQWLFPPLYMCALEQYSFLIQLTTLSKYGNF